MSIYHDDWQERRDREREESRRYEMDVYYEAWRRGLDPDRASECAQDCRYEGRSPDECVDGHERRARDQRAARRAEQELVEQEAQYNQEQERAYCDQQDQQQGEPQE